MSIVDFNLAEGGETANPLVQLLQDIETIMTAKQLEILTDTSLYVDLDRFLFKYNLNTAQLASTVRQAILRGATNTEDYEILVSIDMLSTRQENDMLLVTVQIVSENFVKEQLQYAISNQQTMTDDKLQDLERPKIQ